MPDFGERIKKIRNEKNLSQEKLAEACNISTVFLRHIEKSRRTANTELLVNLCNTLDVSPEYLLQDALINNSSNNEKNEIINYLNKFTPNQLKYFKDWCIVAEKHIINNGEIT